MKKLILILGLIGLLNGDEAVKKVVFDVTTGDIEVFERKVLSGIAYQKSYYENKLEELEVAVVIHGDSYKFFIEDLSKSPYKDDLKLKEKHQSLAKRLSSMSEIYEVEFLMCETGMKRHKINNENLYEYVQLVPNSTIGLINKQSEGYAYIPIAK